MPPWPQVTGSGEVEECRRQLEAGQPWVEGDARVGLEQFYSRGGEARGHNGL
jgi:hypothetical protein